MKFIITESKLIATTIQLDANSIEEAEKIYYERINSGQIQHEELNNWNVVECYTDINEH